MGSSCPGSWAPRVFSRPWLALLSGDHSPLAPAKVIVWCDAAWVAVTIPFVLMVEMSRTGELGAIVIAYVVLGFSVVQYLGIRRFRQLDSAD